MNNSFQKIEPLCPVFGECGGCQFQDIAYSDELCVKENNLKQLFADEGLPTDGFSPIVPSPQEYCYRCRLDMKFLKIKSGEMFMGFTPVKGFKVVAVESCSIAMKSISDFLPELRKQACAKIPAKYRNANLTIKTGDDGRVFWGGIGKRSLRMDKKDYFWTEFQGRRIFYSLEAFFQANLSILPKLMDAVRSFDVLDKTKTFFDLYGGVGLFGICFADGVSDVILIEENIYAIQCARHNVAYNKLGNFQILEGRMEDEFPKLLAQADHAQAVAMIDPPRAGLSESVRKMFGDLKNLDTLIYLSCKPETLARDLKDLIASGWKISEVIPFDFFPKTRHLETLVFLKRRA